MRIRSFLPSSSSSSCSSKVTTYKSVVPWPLSAKVGTAHACGCDRVNDHVFAIASQVFPCLVQKPRTRVVNECGTGYSCFLRLTVSSAYEDRMCWSTLPQLIGINVVDYLRESEIHGRPSTKPLRPCCISVMNAAGPQMNVYFLPPSVSALSCLMK
ncbi:hypothetical protein KC341_g41 [Hortaea werneckii]|nr:hypothetical protein KC341_g41 [Hortaea werneckii]